MPRPAALQTLAHHLDQFRQQEEIVLKERIRRHVPTFRLDAQHDFQAPFRRWMGPHLSYSLVERRLGDGAFLDIDHETIVAADEADV